MKYAVISDIHGNMDALDAVLSDAEKQSADIFLFAGDYCLSMPFPEQAVQRIACMDNAFVIRGNEEQYIERMQGEDEGRWEGGQMHISCWCAQALGDESKMFLRRLPERKQFRDEESGVVFHMSHSSQDIIGNAELSKFSCPAIPLMYKERELKHSQLLCDIRKHLSGNEEFQRQCDKLEDGGIYFRTFTYTMVYAKREKDIYKSRFLRPSHGQLRKGCPLYFDRS